MKHIASRVLSHDIIPGGSVDMFVIIRLEDKLSIP